MRKPPCSSQHLLKLILISQLRLSLVHSTLCAPFINSKGHVTHSVGDLDLRCDIKLQEADTGARGENKTGPRDPERITLILQISHFFLWKCQLSDCFKSGIYIQCFYSPI